MRKQIPIDQVKVGMYLVGVDRPWMETPFLRHRFHIKDESVIEKLYASGIAHIDIDTEQYQRHITFRSRSRRKTQPSRLTMPLRETHQGSRGNAIRHTAACSSRSGRRGGQ